MPIARTAKDRNFEITARCSKCEHTGTLFINDEGIRNEMNKSWNYFFGKIVIRRFSMYSAAVFVWGLALGAWFIG